MSIHSRDVHLIRQVLDGDNSAFDTLYRLHHPQVYAMIARRTSDTETRNDIVQITFMRAYRALSRFRGQSNFSTWLIQIALNTCTSHHRTQRVRQAWVFHTEEPEALRVHHSESLPENPEQNYRRKQRKQLVHEKIKALPKHYRRPVWHRIRLLESSDGALWVAGLGQGAARLDYGSSTWVTYEGLSVRCETPEGTLWFVARPGAVSYDGKRWVHYGVDDGLMDRVFGLISTREGEVWASGSHEGTAATARFDGESWDMMKHFGIPALQSRSAYQASDGSLWFGGDVGDVGGVLKVDGMAWTHYKPPEAPELTYGIGQMADGTMLFGGYHLRSFDGENWSAVSTPRELTIPFVENLYNGRNGDLWVGTRRYGVFHYDPMLPDDQAWTRYDTRHGLNVNDVRFFLEVDDGSILVANGGIISRFDGRTWTTDSLPMGLSNDEYVTSLVQAQDGALLIDMYYFSGDVRSRGTVRYVPDTRRPETEMTLSLDEVSQPGNTTLSWKGSDPWKSTPDKEIQFSWRLDEGEWSPYSQAKNEILQSVPSGDHVFEVRARDRDFNVDESPARVDFTVIPPVWQQVWFLTMVSAFLIVIGLQTSRVIRRGRRLRLANEAMSTANRELFQANVDLKSANEQIQEANQMKSRFLASMSHELRTPMNAIIGFTRLVLRRDKTLADRSKDNLEKVQASADHLLGLINDVLDLSKIEAGRMDVQVTTFDISKLIASCCTVVNPLISTGVTLSNTAGSDIGEGETDEGRVRQIVINLLSNAAKFTHEGEISISATRAEGDLVIAVKDSGIGIPEGELENIFEEFSQVEGTDTERKGTGLGLPITKRLAELLGGTIEVGSLFKVIVPIKYEEGKG